MGGSQTKEEVIIAQTASGDAKTSTMKEDEWTRVECILLVILLIIIMVFVYKFYKNCKKRIDERIKRQVVIQALTENRRGQATPVEI